MNLKYEVLEKVKIKRPVARIAYIVENTKNKHVLDFGSYDETALFKAGTQHSLYSEISRVAVSLTGIDNSSKIPDDGIILSKSSRIIKCDVREIGKLPFNRADFDIIVAGELIEHLADVLEFLREVKELFPGKEFICTTPNALSLSNILLGFFKRESTHCDHLQMYSYKILNTLCVKSGFCSWDIIPYHVYYTEMIHQSTGCKKIIVRFVERMINFFEKVFPLFSGGLILHVKKI